MVTLLRLVAVDAEHAENNAHMLSILRSRRNVVANTKGDAGRWVAAGDATGSTGQDNCLHYDRQLFKVRARIKCFALHV